MSLIGPEKEHSKLGNTHGNDDIRNNFHHSISTYGNRNRFLLNNTFQHKRKLRYNLELFFCLFKIKTPWPTHQEKLVRLPLKSNFADLTRALAFMAVIIVSAKRQKNFFCIRSVPEHLFSDKTPSQQKQ